jgi:hypothetical protein
MEKRSTRKRRFEDESKEASGKQAQLIGSVAGPIEATGVRRSLVRIQHVMGIMNKKRRENRKSNRFSTF